ncbi:hypothetical protein GCM10027562_29240 [Arthrobacter pigmenti]
MKRAFIENAVIWLVANIVLFLVLDEKYDFVLGPILTAAGMLAVTLLEVGAKREALAPVAEVQACPAGRHPSRLVTGPTPAAHMLKSCPKRLVRAFSPSPTSPKNWP